MIYYYLQSADDPQKLNYLQTTFQRTITTPEGLDSLKVQLYDGMQADAENIVYPELLQWVFIQQKDYKKAFRQARSLDRKLEENGSRVIKLADIAYNDKDYPSAIQGFNYIIENKGSTSTYYVEAKRKMLKSKQKEVLSDYNYTSQEIDTLAYEYKSFIDEFGVNNETGWLVKEYAEFLAVYKNDLPGATKVLEELVGIASIKPYIVANAKLSLADYYLMQGEIWESTLLYSQVDKEFREEFLGEKARFKNAKLAYYNGDFQWSQAQFDILKAATSRLISNDAIDLSVLIVDNLGLDTTDAALKMFAESELLAFQNKHDQAFQKLDSINIVFPEHSLADDVYYTKANLYRKLKDIDNAIVMYDKIIADYPEEIRCDNAIYELAEIYDFIIEDKEKAQVLYEKLFIDYSNSTFAVDARKRYRVLRGDNI